VKERFKNILSGIAGSYSQVFFSDNPWLALLLLLASFADPFIGLSGLISVIYAMIAAHILGLNATYIRNGSYTYNVLLTGMAMGAYFQFNTVFIAMLAISSVLSLVISVWLASWMARYRVPFLSIPFILSVWIIFLNARGLQTNLLTERNVFICHSLFAEKVRAISAGIEQSGLHHVLLLYFKTMASIFFQDKIVAGLLISLGLLISSRITFVLSWLGFLSGYVFFRFMYGAAAGNDFFYVGSNYIFSAIALAGFYLVPSLSSYLLIIFSTPLIAFFTAALLKIVGPYYLPLYSMPFSVTVILIIAVLNNRYSVKYLDFVQYQLYSPEKNLYAFHTYMERFRKDTYFHIHLPFYGEWSVSQGHSGNITHKEDWRFAWDFVVTSEHGQTFRLPGKNISDFYCFSLPVLASADGVVITVEDGIEDNTIGDVNLQDNWGNTIIIKHGDHLYSKLSHLKKGSIKVKTGDQVKRGELIAACGNSGRSPEPHIHFQLQTTPYIGAPTLDYPISYYVVKKDNAYKLHAFDIPKEGELIMRPSPTPLIRQAFHFIPGMKLNFEVMRGDKQSAETWEVFTDAFNSSYLYCAETKSTAHFTNNDTLFYFTGFSGDKDSLLYYFYLAAYKVVMSYYPGLETRDRLPVETSRNLFLKPLQDIVAPFYIFMRPSYRSVFKEQDNKQSPGKLCIQSGIYENESQQTAPVQFEIELSDNRIHKISITKSTLCMTAKNTG
jgi:urea transporter/murein DD-endopeptidase MepM/ murein hydrolase activator NlpD